MQVNMGKVDRAARALLVAPVAVVSGLVVGPATVGGAALLLVAAVMLMTSAVGSCPLYRVLGVSTCPRGA